MSDLALKVQGLYKQYRLGVVGSDSLKDDIKITFSKLLGKRPENLFKVDDNNRMIGDSKYVWALKEINFSVKKGEILGIIGKNGAGKSTLLKILSKVTGPTKGSIMVSGKIASLLEVGTGFHPELTGKENIFLNGAILGMKKPEIKSKLDEIVDFSGIGKYIDTPAKRYSSGMKVRLGFAVAAHLEPEILIVDEVLAVGDAEFQKKCIGKMNDVSKNEGRTVLFVSHNMNSIQELCNKGLFLKDGQVDFMGSIQETIPRYLSSYKNTLMTSDLTNIRKRNGNGLVRFSSIKIIDDSKNEINFILSGQNITIELGFENNNNEDTNSFHISVSFVNDLEQPIFHLSTLEGMGKNFILAKTNKQVKVYCTVKNIPLPSGIYSINLYCSNGVKTFDEIIGGARIKVEAGNFFNTGRILDAKWGVVLQKSFWDIEYN